MNEKEQARAVLLIRKLVEHGSLVGRAAPAGWPVSQEEIAKLVAAIENLSVWVDDAQFFITLGCQLSEARR